MGREAFVAMGEGIGGEMKPTGFVAMCRCGSVVGAMDYERTDRKEAGRILGQWLRNGCTVVPRFSGSWSENIRACHCKQAGKELMGR